MIVTSMQRGGMETFTMNVYRAMDRTKVQFDFLLHRDFKGDYDDEIERMGGRLYRIRRQNPLDPVIGTPSTRSSPSTIMMSCMPSSTV